MAFPRKVFRLFGKIYRGIFGILTPFVASNATVRNNQFVSLFFLLIIFLSCIILMVNGFVDVKTTTPAIHVQHQYEYAIFVFVLLELIYWIPTIFCRRDLKCSWSDVKWRLCQDLGGFICCADIPEYKRNHLQNHLLYGSVFVALVINSYCMWLLTRSVLLYTCSSVTEDLSFYAGIGDCLVAVALIFHIWIQIIVAFRYRKGQVVADCSTLSGIIWLISLNFVLYLQITMSEAMEVKHSLQKYNTAHHVEPLERCRRLNSSSINFLDSIERHHVEWVRPLGYALTVEFVLTLNTVFFSLWYHAKEKHLAGLDESELDEIIEISIEPDEEYAITHDAFGEITLRPDRTYLTNFTESGLGEIITSKHKILLDVNCRKYSLPMSTFMKDNNGNAKTRNSVLTLSSFATEPNVTYIKRASIGSDSTIDRMPTVLRNPLIQNEIIASTENLPSFDEPLPSGAAASDNAIGSSRPILQASSDEELDESRLQTSRASRRGRKSQVSFASGSPPGSTEKNVTPRTMQTRSRFQGMAARRRSVAVKKDPRNIPFFGSIAGCILCTPLLISAGFAYTVSKRYNAHDEANNTDDAIKEELAYSAKLYEASVMVTQAVVSCISAICLVFLSKLTPSRRMRVHEKIDIILLLITMTGMMTLASFATSAVVYPWIEDFANESKNLKIITGFEVLIGVIQVFLQTMFIAKAFSTESTRHDLSHVTIFGRRVQRKRVGKVLTELSMVFTVYSVLMWFINAFYERRSYSMMNQIATQFYPKQAWFAVTEITYPMSICFYYHSMICFTAIITKFASPW